ncbi:MAG: putative conserved transrane protein [Mycobacterium sp.]|nr:putative conserved transrane protein [Mycobacterium sp.]
MQPFTFDPRRWHTVRSLGRNPLVRLSDRVEAVAVALAVTVSLLCAPVAAALGTSVYTTHNQLYTAQAQTIHSQRASVTAARASEPSSSGRNGYRTVTVRWKAGNVEHANTSISHAGVGVGDQIDIWVDREGNRVMRPPGHAQATVDAVAIAVLTWLGVVTLATALVAAIRWGLGVRRGAYWEHEIMVLVDKRRRSSQ